MSYTTPFTAVAGTAWKAADWNTYGRDDIAWLATDSPACRAFNSAAISIANTTFTAATYDSERFDNASVHSTSSNTSRMTVPTGGGGKYAIGFTGEFTPNATGIRVVDFYLNGTTRIGTTAAPASSDTSPVSNFVVYAFSAADYVEARVWQNSTGALNLLSTGNFSPEFYVFWFRN